MTGQFVKIAYVDNGETKVIRGNLVSSDEHTYTLRVSAGYNVVIGKAALIKLTPEVSQ